MATSSRGGLLLALVALAAALGGASAAVRVIQNDRPLTDTGPPRKQLAGPPSEFAGMALPKPLDGALAEDSCAADVVFAEKKNFGGAVNSTGPLFSYTGDLVVDSTTAWMFTTFIPVPQGASLAVSLHDPNGKEIDLAPRAHKGEFPIGGMKIPETTYTFKDGVIPGAYVLSVSLQTSRATPAADLARLRDTTSGTPHGETLVWNQSPIVMHAHLNTYTLVTNKEVGLVARMTDEKVIDGVAPRALTPRQITVEAKIDVTMPDGQEQIVAMHDDGLHGDGEANDGIFAGSFRATEVGNYVLRGVTEGVLADGKTRFRRSTEHLMPVSALEVQLDGKASAKYSGLKTEKKTTSSSSSSFGNSNEKLEIFVGVQPRAEYQRVERKFRAYAQVWGKKSASSATDQAVGWVSQMVNIATIGQDQEEKMGFTLVLDAGWIAAASAHPPFELREVVLQDSANYVPETQLASVPVSLGADAAAFTRVVASRPLTLANMTTEWRQGRNPLPPTPRQLGRPQDHKQGLVLLHGYCSDTNPWEHQKADWSEGYFFLNPKASVGNDAFALLVADFVEKNSLDSFGLVGHSQGGLVSSHLLNYYFTGLDHAVSGNKVQSLGSPYQGCSAAGSIANLGSVFGVGCGENLDLSKDSAKLWGAGISADIKKSVYYYTTSYVAGKLFGDWCSLPMNAILQWPNDGTAELPYTKFDGANDMGNVEKQCHTTEMGYPPQYWNQARNKVLNEQAAR